MIAYKCKAWNLTNTFKNILSIAYDSTQKQWQRKEINNDVSAAVTMIGEDNRGIMTLL